MKISQGKRKTPIKMVVYGPEGIGKSTLASEFPDPLFIDIEKGTNQIDVKRVDENITTFQDFKNILKEIKNDPGICKTLVIDTVDALEGLIADFVCKRGKMDGIESFGYGKGYTYLAEEFSDTLKLFSDLVENEGLNVVLLAHSQISRFEKPDESGGYDRYELKLQKKVAPLAKEWCDVLLFINYKTYVVKGQGLEKNKIKGDERIIFTTHHPAWDAKNRFGLKEELPLDIKSLRPIFKFNSEKAPKKEEPKEDQCSVDDNFDGFDEDFEEIEPPIPDELFKLMEKDGITEEEIVKMSSKANGKDYKDISEIDEDFINTKVIGKWDSLVKAIKKGRK